MVGRPEPEPELCASLSHSGSASAQGSGLFFFPAVAKCLLSSGVCWGLFVSLFNEAFGSDLLYVYMKCRWVTFVVN